MGRKKSFVLVLTFVILASLASLTSGLANEIWVTPSGFSFPSGNWPVSTSPWATFAFSVPNNMTAFESAKLVVIGKVSTTLTYSLGLSIASNGDPQNYYTDSAAGLKATLTMNQLQEIDISSYIPTGKKPGGFKIEPGDYIGLNFHFHPTNAVNVLGLRFQYEGPVGPQGPKGDRGDPGPSPVLSWSGDQIAIDGDLSGPHLTGPKGDAGSPGLIDRASISQNFCYEESACFCPTYAQVLLNYGVLCPHPEIIGTWGRYCSLEYAMHTPRFSVLGKMINAHVTAVCSCLEFTLGFQTHQERVPASILTVYCY